MAVLVAIAAVKNFGKNIKPAKITYHSTITLHSIYPLEYSVADIQQPKN